MHKYKAIKFDTFVIYIPGITDLELTDFIDSEDSEIETSGTKYIKYENDNYYLKEWDEYYVASINEKRLQKFEFNTVGKFYNNSFGILKIKNFIGEILFMNRFFYVESYKMRTDRFNELLSQIDKEIKDLVSFQFSFEGTTGSKFSKEHNYRYDYFSYVKIYNLMEKNELMPYFKHIRKNAVTSFDKVRTTTNISTANNISIDSIIDIFNGNTKLSETNANNKLSRKLNGYVPEFVNEYNYYLHIDTPENQFVKYFLKYLIKNISNFIELIDKEHNDEDSTGSKIILNKLSNHRKSLIREWNEHFYKDISNLTVFDSSNTVLTRKYGYLNIFKEYLNIKNQPKSLFNTESLIDLFQNKSVDKLYEYISLFTILNILRSIYSVNSYLDDSIIVNNQSKMMTLNIAEDDSVNFSFLPVSGLPEVILSFQKTFTINNLGSWSVKFSPDCTLRVKYQEDAVKLFHFDSKFKLNPNLEEKTEDIQKMHSYKDGIFNTYGSYVLYPGDRISRYSDMDDSLMKIGAIPLNSTNNEILKTFIEDILNISWNENI